MGTLLALLNYILNLNVFHLAPHMPPKAGSPEESTNIELNYAGQRSRASSLGSSNTKINHRENAIDSGIILGFARYGHPDGPVYLPTDRELFGDNSSAPALQDSRRSYAPTWEGCQEIWDKLESGELDRTIIHQQQRQSPQRSFMRLTLAYPPSDLVKHVTILDKHSTEQPRDKDLAVVVCAPSPTAEVAQRVISYGYDIDPRALIPFRAKPVPFERKGNTMIIQLGFPRRPLGLWLLQEGGIGQSTENVPDMNYRKGHIRMDSLSLHIKEVDDVPTIISFAHSEDVAESMAMTFENDYWRPRFQDQSEGRDVSRRLPLPFLWYAVRRWDEVSEAVDTFIGSMETVFQSQTAQRLHVLRAHILHSEGLLIRFRSIITAIKMDTQDRIVIDECEKLLLERDRFEFQRSMHEERAKHIIDIMYSHSADRAAEASVRDSRDMMQVSRLTMLFLPASVMAGVFGINSTVFDAQTSLIIYLVLTIPLTVVIIWVFVAMQVENYFKNFPTGAWYRALWPYYVFGPGVRAVDAEPLV
ncbi:hypothetical protein AB1N83_009465 [Pleurotus pulmonarius]